MNFLRLVLAECLYFTNLKNRMYQFLLFFQPLIYLFIVNYMLLMRGGGNEERFVFAVAIMSMWGYVLYSSGSALVSLKWSGTLEMVLNTSSSIFSIILSKAINNAIIGAISLVITFIYAKFIFGFTLSLSNIYGLVLTLFLLLVSLMSMGMVLAIIYSLVDNVYAYQNIIVYPIMIVSGIFYPVELLPLLVQWISYMIPMSWAIQALYYSIDYHQIHWLYSSLCLFVSLLYLFVSYRLLVRMTNKIKETSTLGVF
ncbi:ABC transporter permease [Alkalihalobacillus sp. LMS39]|uniref:ABC transporter permease n=1 Tax=Alkalihalobacillus sp. LMS39 TaxID=2924032 RepID=UPI001FB5287A|nr:ABC transporter permease [Alkalihalobacillus sp. LMS39]UOE95868.1 ABC transporter permease [Alkalihalobacillus sp. LMS39]